MQNYNYILKDEKLSNTVKSISALHIVKNHPLFTERKNLILKLIKFLIKIFLNIIDIILSFFKNIFFKKIELKNKKILLISHLINERYLSSKKDFYFGDLENYFKKKNKTYYKFMINHTAKESLNLNILNRNKNNFILDKYLNFKHEVLIIIMKFNAFCELLYLFFFKNLNFRDFKKLVYSLFEHSTTFTIRMYLQIKVCLKKVKPNYCLLTYEGYPWERLCIKAVKEFNPNIKCVGYQHTPVTTNHKAIFNILNNDFNPDQIWCSHIPSYKLLKQKIKKKNYIKFIGNLTRPKFYKQRSLKKNCFLVLPEGIYRECKNIFKFSLEIAHSLKEFNFIWRVHPVINLKKVFEMLKLKTKDIPKNIIISKNDFLHDIKKSNYVLYKGSAAVLKAVLANNYPVYFKSPKEKNFDPLREILNQKNYCKNRNDLFKLLNIKKKNHRKKQIQYCITKIKKNFFKDPNIRAIFKYII